MAQTVGSASAVLGTSTKNSACGLIQRTREIVPSMRTAPPFAERSSTKYSESEWCAAALAAMVWLLARNRTPVVGEPALS